MSLVIISFAQGFMTLGLNSAIIQKKEVSQLELSTVFYLNLAIALLLTASCFLMADTLANFYNQPAIKPIFRTLSLLFLLNGLGVVSSSLLNRRLDFKTNSILTLIAVAISGAVGIWLAYNGYGVWALVVQQLLSSFLLTILIFSYVRWRPSFIFRLLAISDLWKYSNKLLLSSIVDVLFARMDVLLIGKLFNATILGHYTRAQAMDAMVKQITANSFLGALFPFIAKHQDDKAYLKEIYLRYLHIIAFLAVGLSVTLFVIIKSLFIVLFTERWLYAASLFQIMVIGSFIAPISGLMLNMLTGTGATAAFLRLEVQKKLILIPAYVIGLLLGIKSFIIAVIIAMLAGLVLNAVFVSRQITVSLRPQLWIITTYLIAALCSGTITWLIADYLKLNNHFAAIIIYASLATGIYLLVTNFMRLEGPKIIPELINKVKLMIKSKLIIQA